MAMEKKRLISPAIHVNILQNMDFFIEDRFGICTSSNDSLPTPMDTDSGCKVGDLRDLITGIPAPSKRELFTQPKLTEVQG